MIPLLKGIFQVLLKYLFLRKVSGRISQHFRYYVALAQRFNRLKILKSLLKFSLNRDFYYGTKVTQARVS